MSTVWVWSESAVTHVVDGDTLDAQLHMDIGFYGTFSRVQRLRLIGIDAYKKGTQKGNAAAVRVQELTKDVLVTIYTYKPYKYGDEWMAEIILPDSRPVTEILIEEDLALPWSGKGTAPTKLATTAVIPIPPPQSSQGLVHMPEEEGG